MTMASRLILLKCVFEKLIWNRCAQLLNNTLLILFDYLLSPYCQCPSVQTFVNLVGGEKG